MSLRRDRATAKSLITKAMTYQTIRQIVVGVIQDIKVEGKYPDDTPLSPFHTVGQLRRIDNFEMNEDIVVHLMASAIGRTARLSAQSVNPELIKGANIGRLAAHIALTTNGLEQKFTKRLVAEYKAGTVEKMEE